MKDSDIDLNANQKFHEITIIQTDGDFLILLVDDQTYQILWQNCSLRLAEASADERSQVVVSPSGYGLHWPKIDEYLSIEPLLQNAESISEDNDSFDFIEYLMNNPIKVGNDFKPLTREKIYERR